MKTIEDYTIEQLETGKYVIKTEGIYQDIDFINSGLIETEERAIEIRDLMIEQANTPVTIPKTAEELQAELIDALILDNLTMQGAIDSQQEQIDTLILDSLTA